MIKLSQEAALVMGDAFPDHAHGTVYWTGQAANFFLNFHLNGDWVPFHDMIDVHSHNYIQAAASLIELRVARTPAVDEVAKWRECVESLLHEAHKSELEDEVRAILVRYLQKIFSALDEYQITGAKPVLEAIDETIGRVERDSRYGEKVKKSDVGGKVLRTLGAIVVTISAASQLPTAISFVDDAFQAITHNRPLAALEHKNSEKSP